MKQGDSGRVLQPVPSPIYIYHTQKEIFSERLVALAFSFFIFFAFMPCFSAPIATRSVTFSMLYR